MTERHHHHHHHHSHHHDGGVSEAKDWTEINRAHWDKVASTYNSKETQDRWGDLLNRLTAFIQQNVNWLGVPFLDPSSTFESQTLQSTQKPVRVLDYACGPGTVTAALAGYATEYVGIDISENMAKEYNNRFNASPSATEDPSSTAPTQHVNAHCTVADLFDPAGAPATLSDAKFFAFDLAAVSGGFHHFENVELATERLAQRLRPGGVLMIFDFLAHAPNDLGDDQAVQTIVHHGFDEGTVRRLFEGAGLVDVDLRVMEGGPVRMNGGKFERTGFMAKGRKPVEV